MVFLAFAVVNVIVGGLWLIKGKIKVSQGRKVGTTPARVIGGILALGGGVVPLVLAPIMYATGGMAVMTMGASVVVFILALVSAPDVEAKDLSRHYRWLIFILLLSAFALWAALPDTTGIHIDVDGDGTPDLNLDVHQSLGLDLVGGSQVLLTADLPAGSYTVEDLQNAANSVSRRVNALGVTDASVQVQGSNRILVELPNVSDTEQAIKTIQTTALLEFVDFSNLGAATSQLTGKKILTDQQVAAQQQRDAAAAQAATLTPVTTAEATVAAQATSEATTAAAATTQATSEATTAAAATSEATAEGTAADSATAEATAAADVGAATTPEPTPTDVPGALNPTTNRPFVTVMTGSGLKSAAAQYTNGQWAVQFDLTDAGAAVFGPFTSANVGQPMAIVLDGVVISAPVIRAALTTGGTITGGFTEQQAKDLALQLRSGALPIPLRVDSAQTIGATLGQDSVRLSIRAGIIGVVIVLTFMLVNYRLPGIAADLALLVFIVLNLAVFKLIPVTLTLPAIIGFLISIGTAVDGNILIFERMREELRHGSDLDTAIDNGFARAWTSIRDSNLSTIIISGILFLFGQTPGASIVSGFAVTLALGLLLNLFTAVIVTRTFLHILLAVFRKPIAERSWLLGVSGVKL